MTTPRAATVAAYGIMWRGGLGILKEIRILCLAIPAPTIKRVAVGKAGAGITCKYWRLFISIMTRTAQLTFDDVNERFRYDLATDTLYRKSPIKLDPGREVTACYRASRAPNYARVSVKDTNIAAKSIIHMLQHKEWP